METLNNKNCEFRDNVIDYCEGLLRGKEEEEVKAHLEGCAQCAALCREHREFCEALEACKTDVPAELHDDIMRAVRREALRVRFMKAVKRYAAPIAAALVLAIAVPAVIRNGSDSGVSDSPLQYSLTEDCGMDISALADGKGRLGEPTDGLKAEVVQDASNGASADTYADIVEAPADEAMGDYEVYQHVVENGEVVTCYLCPVLKVDVELLKKLGQDYAELVVIVEKEGILFEADEKLIAALKAADCDTSDIKRADYIRVNAK